MRKSVVLSLLISLTGTSAYARVDHTTFRLEPMPAPSAAPDANACANDLVENPAKYVTVPSMTGIVAYLAERYVPEVNRYADAEEALVAKTLANFKSLTADAASAEAGEDIRVMGLFLMIGDVVNRHARDIFIAPNPGAPPVPKVNRDVFATYLPGISSAETEILARTIETLFAQPMIGVLNDSRMSRFDYLVSYIIGIAASNGVRGSREAILAGFAKDGLLWLSQLETRIGSADRSGTIRGALEKIVAGRPLDSTDRRAVVKFYPQWVMQLIVLDGAVRKVLEKSTLTFVDVARVTDLEKRLQTAAGVIGARRLELRKKVVDRCRKNVGDALAHFPTKAQLEKAASLIESVRSEAILAAPDYIGEPYTAISVDRLKRVSFDLPESQIAQSSTIVQTLVLGEKAIARSSSAIDGKSAKDRAMTLLDVAGDFLGAGSVSSAKDEPLYLAGLRGRCGELLSSYSMAEMDAYLNGTIYVGWQSVFYPEYGVATYAHEIAHAASFIGQTTSDGWILPMMTIECSHKNHAYLRSNLPGADQRFAQEDFADAFSATVTSRMKAKYGTEVAGLLGTMLALKNPKGERLFPADLENANPKDTHSGLLGREILYRLGLGEKLPASCQAILLPPLSYKDGDFKTLQSCSVR